MDLGVNGKRCLVYGKRTLNDFSVMAHEEKVTHSNMAEMHPKGIHPEMVKEFWIASGNVPGNPLIEPKLGEQPKTGSQALLSVQSFFFNCSISLA